MISGIRLGRGARAAAGRSQAWKRPCPASAQSSPACQTGLPRHRVTAGQAPRTMPFVGGVVAGVVQPVVRDGDGGIGVPDHEVGVEPIAIVPLRG